MKVAMTMEEKNAHLAIIKEQNNLKRMERILTVDRIQRQNEYHRDQIKAKIQQDNMKTKALKDQKDQILMQRKTMQKEAAV